MFIYFITTEPVAIRASGVVLKPFGQAQFQPAPPARLAIHINSTGSRAPKNPIKGPAGEPYDQAGISEGRTAEKRKWGKGIK